MEKMKTYKAVLLGVLGLVIVVGGSYWYMKGKPVQKEAVVKSTTRTIEGEVVRKNGDNEVKVVYNLDIPEGATTTLGMNDALINIVSGTKPLAEMYFTYEGARGYSVRDYIDRVIAPQVKVTVTGTTTIGSSMWTVAESLGSEWHVAQVGDGSWLLVVENKRDLHDDVMNMLDTLVTK